MLMSTIDDTTALVPWTEVNTDALNWPPLEEAVLRALAVPVPEGFGDAPLLRFANPKRSARTLLDAMLEPRIPRHKGVCDIFGTPMQEPNTLWVPCGRSVVQVTMRNFARDLLADHVGTNLHWS